MDNLLDIPAQANRLAKRHNRLTSAPASAEPPTLPAESTIQAARSSLCSPSSASYLTSQPQEAVASHIAQDIVPALSGQNQSARYLGFVTGGVLPLAEWADNVAARYDQNVQVHLPAQSIATDVEDAALEMLVRLFRFQKPEEWKGRTFTTGATASNVMGLAVGRESVVNKRLEALGFSETVGNVGLLAAAAKAGVSDVQVLASAGHSSLAKAASVVGLGRLGVKDMRASDDQPWKLDLDAVEEALQRPGVVSIIGVGAGEVNTGRYALDGIHEWKRLRNMADQYGAWIHVDGAFGIFARALDETDEYKLLYQRLEGIELADSITVDGHKLLNVPYDCGMFLCKSPEIMQAVFTNPNASYLASSAAATIPSPLNIGLENSRRFRALPAYAVLLSEGRQGMASLLANMTRLSRHVAAYLRDSPHYELLPSENDSLDEVFICVLFKAKSAELNNELVQRINETRQMYVSGTSWKGEKAVRIAVSNWRVDVERDGRVICEILECIAEGREFDICSRDA